MAYDKSKKNKIKESIIENLSIGKSLKSILDNNKSMPSRQIIYNWLNKDHDDFDVNFLDNYIRARENSADVDAERVQEVAEKTLEGVYDANSARVAIDAFKWTAGRKLPKKYGNKIDVTSGDKPIKQLSQVEVVVRRYNED